jgi:hypothetical protein
MTPAAAQLPSGTSALRRMMPFHQPPCSCYAFESLIIDDSESQWGLGQELMASSTVSRRLGRDRRRQAAQSTAAAAAGVDRRCNLPGTKNYRSTEVTAYAPACTCSACCQQLQMGDAAASGVPPSRLAAGGGGAHQAPC